MMITLEQENMRFMHRVVGVAIRDDGQVLLHRAEWEPFWSLPGGRVELMEPSAVALQREMMEELDVEVSVGRLLWVIENFFEYQSRHYHELGLYYLMTLPAGSPLLLHDGPFPGDEQGIPLIFQWFPIAALETLSLLPSVLSRTLASLPSQTEHIIHRDGHASFPIFGDVEGSPERQGVGSEVG
jgi:ADP-ribose pyrophosphatase YjhB (NUDIX family)